MQPAPGARLAHYEISALLGKGGMGEVWRATDTKLGRDVAIKVLPEEFTRDGERLARFEREARLLASLDHSNIASIHGIEEVDGYRFLVMQLAEGEDLAERLKKGAIPVDEAIAIARQIAEALEAAHEKGIIHRDLKPANIKLGDDGRVRVLDFGLAKALDAEEGDADITNSPTMVRAATHAGMILGTAAYMSPEQARGKKVDRRADIWSFGVVLWEMLTGERMFLGETVSDTLAAVLTREVDLSRLPAATPDNIRALIGRCLARDPRERLQAIGDARIELAHPQSADARRGAAIPTPPTSPLARWLPWLVALVALALSVWLAVRPRPAPNSAALSYELAILPPERQALVVGSNRAWGIISPDGKRVAFLATSDAGTGLWVRSLARDDARFVPGTEDAFYPFWSPDSRWLAFFADGKLRKVDPGGGLPEVICAASQGRGGSWGGDGWIYFTPSGGGEVHRVRAEGGTPSKLTTIDPARGETAHYWPQAIGDGRFLYFIRSSKAEFEGIYLGTVDASGKGSKSARVVASSSSGLFVPAESGAAGHILWVQDGHLLARPMDPATGALSGSASDLGISVDVVDAQRAAMMSVANDGTVVFLPPSNVSRQLGSWSRTGAGPVVLDLPPGVPFEPRVSPDGRSLGFALVNGGDADIWHYDFARGSATPVTSGPSYDEAYTWSPDSREILHGADSPPLITITRTKVRGVESKVVFTDRSATSRRILAVAWMPDGIVLLANSIDTDSVSTLAAPVVDLEQQAPLIEGGLAICASPDGKWVLYEAGSPGRTELMVASLRRENGSVVLGADRQRVAVQRGSRATFARGGREILLVAADGFLYSVSVGENADGLTLGAPVKLFRAPTVDDAFAASPDGETLYFSFEPDAKTRTLRVLGNWKARLGVRSEK